MIYLFLTRLLYLFFRIFCRIDYVDVHKVPKKGAAILAANHVSYYDPLAIGVGFYRKLHYMAKEELFKEWFGPILTALTAFPVRRGHADRKALKMTLNLLKDGELIGIFPEGKRSPDGEIKEAEPGMAIISIMSGTPIIPVAIVGSRKTLVRKFPPKFKKIMVKYGDAIPTDQFEGSKKERAEKMTNKVMEEIKRLRRELEEIWEP
jgi:1-acyl-sn-glycerol-3-phosphate acyltransferase